MTARRLDPKTNTLVAALLASGLLLGWGCSSDEKKGSDGGSTSESSNSAGSGSGGTASSSSSSTASSTTSGPAISSAPEAWERPAECMGIGNLCPNLSGCEEGSLCQSSGSVCIPNPGEGMLLPGKSEERPYCAAFTCMTFEEASCFCTGEAGDLLGACQSPSALAGLCSVEGGSCSTTECCDGFTCVQRSSTSFTCLSPCTSADDCESGCCTDLYDTGDMVCADLDACENPCRKRGETCEAGDSSTPNNCCQGACVDSENPNFGGCRPRCNTNEDCTQTGCCRLFADSTNGFCVDALYCSCGEVDARCGEQDTPNCCDGLHCTGSEGNFTCSKDCTSDADCPETCCVSINGADYMACGGPENCP